jgi:hypothetical protein
MEDTMRDLLSKLDQILNESTQSHNSKDSSWVKDPKDSESKIPAIFRKSKQAGKDSSEKTIDDLNKKSDAKVWKTAREDQDMDESGLQYHIGKKKYGKDGMNALAQAGRDGADEEELGRIKDRYKKENFEVGDAFGISLSEDFEIGTEIIDILEDGIVVELDQSAIDYLSKNGFTFDEGEIVEGKQHGNSKIYDKCWKGYKKVPGKARGEPGSCKKISEGVIKESPNDFRSGLRQMRSDTQDKLSAIRSKSRDTLDMMRSRSNLGSKPSQTSLQFREPEDTQTPKVGAKIEWGHFKSPERKSGIITRIKGSVISVKTDQGEEEVHLGNKSLSYSIVPRGMREDDDVYKRKTPFGYVTFRGDRAKAEKNIDLYGNPYGPGNDDIKGRDPKTAELHKKQDLEWDREREQRKEPVNISSLIYGGDSNTDFDDDEGDAFSNVVKFYKNASPEQRKEIENHPDLKNDPEALEKLKRAAGVEEDVREGTMDDIELYGLRIGDTVRTKIKGQEVQGDIIDIFPDTKEVELLLRGPEAGKTITVDVRQTEYIGEAKYQGREVPLGKPMAGDVKKSKVYVKNDKGNVVKVNFGDKKMKIKKSNPSRRKSFRARHNCKNPGPRWKARYWSCRAW